eukprot:1002839-Rhodomonas_salina.3
MVQMYFRWVRAWMGVGLECVADGRIRAGAIKNAVFNDLHAYDIASGGWADLSSTSSGTPPVARYSMGMAESGSKLYIFGGHYVCKLHYSPLSFPSSPLLPQRPSKGLVGAAFLRVTALCLRSLHHSAVSAIPMLPPMLLAAVQCSHGLPAVEIVLASSSCMP